MSTSGHVLDDGPDGQGRLPSSPSAAARALHLAAHSDLDAPAIAERVARDTGEPAARVRGLLGWLPLSRVAAWADDGALWLAPDANGADLALRYAAWVASRPVPPPLADAVKAYARAVIEEAGRLPVEGVRAKAPRPPDAVPPPDPGTLPAASSALHARLRRLIDQLDASFLERRAQVRAALLALLAGQHTLLLGPPGTAKSLLARALCATLTDQGQGGRYFEYLLSRFTHPDELFGPVSIAGLKSEDYRRLTEGYLPDAHVAFLDEIFKANSAILNALLTLVNERVFHHGRHRDRVPLLGVVGASNELPDPDGGLGALYDRFLVRLTVPPLRDEAAFLAVATGRLPEFAPQAADRLDPAEITAIAESARAIEVPPAVSRALLALWRAAQAHEWGVSDRRWRQALHYLQVAAHTDGRAALQPVDLLLLVPVLAAEPDRAAEVRDVILDLLGAHQLPESDLRAQWTLLHLDRVAPVAGEPPPIPPSPRRLAWPERLARRQASVRRLLAVHAEAVDAVAADRARLEQIGARHLWLAELPPPMLAAHIAEARSLSKSLAALEAYLAQVTDPALAVAHHLGRLPSSAHRLYASDTVCVLHVVDAKTAVTLSVNGEASPIPVPQAPPQGPLITVSAVRFLDWIDGTIPTEQLTDKIPSWTGRQVHTALESARKHLGGDAVPPPLEPP